MLSSRVARSSLLRAVAAQSRVGQSIAHLRSFQTLSVEKVHLSLPLEQDEQIFRMVNEGLSSSATATVDRSPLPRSLAEIFDKEQGQERAVVMTEMYSPFRIVHVNEAWEGLCGYELEECRGKSLRMLQGPETNLSAITSLLHNVMRGEEAGTVLTNYTKNGRRFRNYLRIGPLNNEPFLVGILQEINDGN